MGSSPPVIIIGMHRSGTSLVTRVLEDLGLFVGRRLQADHESVFFVRLNDWILRQANASWDRPSGIDDLLADAKAVPLIVDYLQLRLNSPHAAGYLGAAAGLKAGFRWQPRAPWGWKDPRTTFTLPFWLQLFPQARLIHVARNGVDVARSLVVREDQLRSLARRRLVSRRLPYRLRARLPDLVSSSLCSDRESAFLLWQLYFDRAREAVRSVGARGLSLRYEDFLAHPRAMARSLARHASLSPSDRVLERSIERIDASRSYAFVGDDWFQERARTQWRDALAHRGYPLTDLLPGSEP